MEIKKGKEVKKTSNMLKGAVISCIAMVIAGFMLFYLILPALNIHSAEMWSLTMILLFITIGVFKLVTDKNATEKEATIANCLLAVVPILLIVFVIVLFSGSKLFRAKDYARMLEPNIKTESFDNYKATLDTVPLLDKESAMLIANRKMGSLEDVVSQFEISDSEQITVNGESVRVSILDYAGFFKWLNNKEEGTPGYIRVDMQDQKAEIVKLDNKIKYSEGAFFGNDINRYLRFKHPTLMFERPSIELDEDNHPYWIAPIKEYTIGLFGGKDINGLLTVDAVTGEIQRYALEDVPTWIDNVYPSDLLLSQYDSFGTYQGGFLNSIFGQQGVKETTKGYNYIPQGDDNWIYTGVTSVVRDESNIGFLLMNKRTKETVYYPLGGAEEYSAMSSAEGVVQHLGYTSTFPLLLQIEDQPTYLISLKDEGSLVKMYGMVNVERFQIVATGTTIKETQAKYRELLVDNEVTVPDVIEKVVIVEEVEYEKTVEGKIVEIKTAVKNGNTHFYIKIEGLNVYYELNINKNEEAIILQVGDDIELEMMKDEGNVVPAILK